MNVAQETLGFRRQGLSPCLSLLMSAFALPIAPACLSTHLHSPRERSSTTVVTPSSPLSNTSMRFATRKTRNIAHARRKTRWRINVLEGVTTIRSFGYRLEPRYIFRAGRLDQ